MERASRVQLQQHTNGAQSSVDRGLQGGGQGVRVANRPQVGMGTPTRSTNIGSQIMTKSRYKIGDPDGVQP